MRVKLNDSDSDRINQIVYRTDKPIKSESDGVMGVDIGEGHPIVCPDGVNATIFNGGISEVSYTD